MGPASSGAGSYLAFFWAYGEDMGGLIAQHLLLVGWALPLALAFAVGLGVALADRPRAGEFALGVAGILTTVPSVALFGLLIPLLGSLGLGVGRPPAILAVALYSVLPILRNTLVGLRGVPPAVIESARGMGLSEGAIFWRVRLPLALPVILAGVRTAAVMGIGITAIAAYVGAGGLGRWVFGGIRRAYPEMALAGALLIGMLAFVADGLLAWASRLAGRRLGLA